MIEIRWHGRGGQGAKTVSELFARALLDAGNYVQAFPEYGPERSGAPVQAYTRSASEPIRLHCGVTDPGAVVVLDATLTDEVDVTQGLKATGLLLINTPPTDGHYEDLAPPDGALKLIDANRLAREVESEFSNMVMAGALAAAIDEPPLEALKQATEEKLGAKLSDEKLTVNMRALEAGYSNLKQPKELA